ncbi:10680_t:CDS:10 [Funneliformis mosseae]|uniref:10680_t:CDS:1 n=1 Tax=Funneliformis mosseae TaxID=27381 RepID=A0A9N8ZKU9_FUNMO|nr:10680_t:CDS:10 [Funneliformis mosseae]
MSESPSSNSQEINNDRDLLSNNRVINERDSSKTQRESDANTMLNEESPTATLGGDINASTLELSDITIHVCSNCGDPAQYLCMACGQSGPRYCSPKCQTENWTKGHSSVCKAAHAGQLSNVESGEGSVTVSRSNSKVYARGQIAQIINKKGGNSTLSSPARVPSFTNERPSSTNQASSFDENQVDEFRFYMQQVYRIIKPVVVCILLSVFWVKLSILAPEFRYDMLLYQKLTLDFASKLIVFNDKFRPKHATQQFVDTSENTPESTYFLNSFLVAAIIIGQIIVVTIIIVCLFKHGITDPYRFLYGCGTSTSWIHGKPFNDEHLRGVSNSNGLYYAYFCIVELCCSRTYFCFLERTSVIATNVFDYYVKFDGLSSWTTWILLALLAIWDLIAVLCPFGPLRILVESSRDDQREIPALLYSVNAVWLMASPGLSNQFTSFNSLRSSSSSFQGRDLSTHTGEEIPLSENIKYNRDNRNVHGEGEVEGVFVNVNDTNENSRRQSLPDQPPQPNDDSLDDDEEEKSGLKLGLGDFVFYSVLVAQAALFDWITTVACIVAVLTGLNTTIFLLAIYKKALPALPISIAFGMLFYFVTRYTLVPYAQFLGLFLIAV